MMWELGKISNFGAVGFVVYVCCNGTSSFKNIFAYINGISSYKTLNRKVSKSCNSCKDVSVA